MTILSFTTKPLRGLRRPFRPAKYVAIEDDDLEPHEFASPPPECMTRNAATLSTRLARRIGREVRVSPRGESALQSH
jgi:hypothetical protein